MPDTNPPTKCVYLSLHHITACDKISQVLFLHTVSNQKLNSGEGSRTRLEIASFPGAMHEPGNEARPGIKLITSTWPHSWALDMCKQKKVTNQVLEQG